MTQDYQGPQAPQPPDELVQEWRDALWAEGVPTTPISRELATRAAAWAWEQAMTTLATREQAAADAELEWCSAWLVGAGDRLARDLRAAARAARRPKPPTMAEKAIAALARWQGVAENSADEDAVRTALLRLQELEQAATATTETTHD